MEYSFQAPIRIRNNDTTPASWWFITVPQDISEQIKTIASSQPRKGRGSMKVQAMIGYLKRETSIFTDKKSGSYLLPIKANIRNQLRIKEGDQIHIQINIIYSIS